MGIGRIIAISGALATACLSGCMHSSPWTDPTTRPTATSIDPKTAEPEYWLARPATVSVSGRDYARLVNACEHVLRQRFFEIDQLDYRSGVVVSKPLISQQCWEFWRSDVEGWSQLRNSSLASYRRTVYWAISAKDDGSFIAQPKVVIERISGEPRRVTDVTHYQASLSNADSEAKVSSPRLGTAPKTSWYALGRDVLLEESLAEDLREQMAK